FGFESIFIVSLAVIIFAFVISLFIKGLPKPEPSTTDNESKQKGLSAYIQKEALPISFVIIFVGIAYSSVLSFLTVYTEHIILAAGSSFFFIVYTVSSCVTRPFTGEIYEHRREKKGMYRVFISFMVGLILLSATHTRFLLRISPIFIGI